MNFVQTTFRAPQFTHLDGRGKRRAELERLEVRAHGKVLAGQSAGKPGVVFDA